MAIVDGVYGQLTITADGSETATIISDARIFRWRGVFAREMREVTPKNSAIKTYLPGHGISIVYLEAWIEQTIGGGIVGPGAFNTLPAELWLEPSGGDGVKKMYLTGWVEEFQWLSAIDEPNTFRARFRGNSDPVYTWAGA